MPAVGPSPAEAKLVLTAAWQPQVISSVMLFGLAILGADLLSVSLIFGSLGVGFLAWFRAFKLELNDSHLTYHAPLVRKKVISVNRIRRVIAQRVTIESFGYQTIVVESKDGDSASFVINAQVLPKKETIALFNELGKRGVSVNLT
jgi:hypothetical protein